MRSTIRLATALLLAAGWATLSAQVALPNQSAPAGSSVVVPVVFASRAGSQISGLQFDLQYDSGVMSLAVTLGEAIRSSGKSLYSRSIAANRHRFLIAGLNQNAIPDGVLMNLFVNLNSNAPVGSYPLRISDIAATDPFGWPPPTPIQGVNGVLTVTGSAGQRVRLQPDGVLNGGSFLPGPVAPGEIITLIGSEIGPAVPTLPPAGSASSTALGGTSVLFDGTPAPLLYASSSQINAIAPYGTYQKPSTRIQVVSRGAVVAELTQAVTASSPALLTLDSSGAGPGAILNQDSNVNMPSNRAAKGSVVVLFATGAGQTTPSGVDGQITEGVLPKPLLPVSVQIGGVTASVLYAGAAPGQIAGLLQVNCLVPLDAPSGPAVPVVLSIGQTRSQAGATVAVE